MHKIFLTKLIMMFTTVAVIGGVSTITLPILNSEQTTIRKSQASNTKENNIKDVTVDSQNAQKNDADKESDLTSDSKESNNDSQNNQDTNNQKADNTKLEKTNNNVSRPTTTNAQSKKVNNKTNTKTQDNTTATVEEKTPTISYDRTTSIYANDNVTLLRVEYYKNNKLIYYSVVEQFDAVTKSYVEKIYQCNRVTNIDPLIRTDVYTNGSLVKSY